MERAFSELDAFGYCLTAGQYQRDTFALSVPLQLGNPAVSMALNCSAVGPLPEPADIREALAPALMKTAQLLAVELSASDGSLF